MRGGRLEDEVRKISELEHTSAYTYPLARLQEAMNKIWQRKDLPLDVRLKLYDNLRRQFENLFSQSKREDEVSEGVVDEKRAIFPKTPATPTTPVTPRRRSPHRKTPIRRKSARLQEKKKKEGEEEEKGKKKWVQIKFNRQ